MHRAFLLAALAAAVACGDSPGAGPLSPLTSGHDQTFADGTYRFMLFSRSSCTGSTTQTQTAVSVRARFSAGASPGTYTGRPESSSGGAYELRLSATGSTTQPPFQVPMTGSIIGWLQDEGATPQIPSSGVRVEALTPGSSLGLEGNAFPGVTAHGVVLGPVQFSDGSRIAACSSATFILSGPLN